MRFVLVAFLILCCIYSFSNERAYCIIGVSELLKNDFDIKLIDYINATEVDTTEIIIQEFPEDSGNYIVSKLPMENNSAYYFSMTYKYKESNECIYYYPFGNVTTPIHWLTSIELKQYQNTWKQYDTLPYLQLTISNYSGDVIGFSCKFSMVNVKKRTKKISDADCQYAYTEEGGPTRTLTLVYTFSSEDTNMNDCANEQSCMYYGEFTLSKTGSIITFPANNSLLITIVRKL